MCEQNHTEIRNTPQKRQVIRTSMAYLLLCTIRSWLHTIKNKLWTYFRPVSMHISDGVRSFVFCEMKWRLEFLRPPQCRMQSTNRTIFGTRFGRKGCSIVVDFVKTLTNFSHSIWNDTRLRHVERVPTIYTYSTRYASGKKQITHIYVVCVLSSH